MGYSPREFDIAPAAELEGRLRCALPDECILVWRSLRTLPVSTHRIVAIDPMFYSPTEAGGQLLKWPYTAADVRVQVIEASSGAIHRIARLLIIAPGCDATKFAATELGSIAVDSGHVMIADVDRLRQCWKPSEDELSWLDAAEIDADYRGSFEELQERQDGSGVCTLDADGAPYLICVASGWGDGIYWWDALWRGNELVGYVCNFMEDEVVPIEERGC